MKIDVKTFLLKSTIFPVLYAVFNPIIATILSIVIVATYREIIALIFRVKAMPAMDMCTFFGLEKCNTNIISVIYFQKQKANVVKRRFLSLIEKIPKLRYTIVEIMGDLYYKEIGAQEAIEGTFKIMTKDEELKNE